MKKKPYIKRINKRKGLNLNKKDQFYRADCLTCANDTGGGLHCLLLDEEKECTYIKREK